MTRKGVTSNLLRWTDSPRPPLLISSPRFRHNAIRMFHVHGYESAIRTSGFRYPAMEYSRAAAVASQLGKGLWLSEWGPDQAKGMTWG